MVTSAALGAFIGYFTNALAIKALFRPLKPRWYSLGWQGVIPKNRDRLADNIARVVGEDLLYRDYLLEQIERPALQESLHSYLQGWGRRLLGVKPAEVFARLPATWREHSLQRLLERALSLLADWSQSEAGQVFARELATGWVDVLRRMPLKQILAPQEAEKLVEAAGKALVDEDLRRRLDQLLTEELSSFLGSEQSLSELLPAELEVLLRQRLRDEVPGLLERLAQWLSGREHVEHLSERLLAALELYVEEESSVRGLIGSLSLRLFRNSIRDAITERLPQVAHAYLHSPETRSRIEGRLAAGVDHLLSQPLGKLVGDHRQALVEQMAGTVSTWATSEEARVRLQKILTAQYRERAERPLGEWISAGGREGLIASIATLLVGLGAKSGDWAPDLAAGLRRGVQGAERPLREYLGLDDGQEQRLLNWGQTRVTELLRREVPILLEQVDIAGMVRERVMSYDLLRVEGLVKNIIHDQLRYINLLGALMGGVVGLLLPLINSFLP